MTPPEIGTQQRSALTYPKVSLKKPPTDIYFVHNAPELQNVSEHREPRVRTDLLKLLYISLLQEMSFDDVREFWQGHPLKTGSAVLRDNELFEFLWGSRQYVPISYMIRVLNGVEPFLNRNSIQLLEFLDEMLEWFGTSTPFSPRDLLAAGIPLVDQFVTGSDPRALLLQNLHHFSAELAPDSPHLLVRHEEVGGLMHGTVLMVPNRSFANSIAGLDPQAWLVRILQTAPRCFDAKPFEKTAVLCDPRKIVDIVSEEITTSGGCKPLLNGQIREHAKSLYQHGIQHGIDFSKYNIPDCEVIEIDQDYFCRTRGRVVLHKGCAYGAGIYLYSVAYEKPETRRENRLMRLFRIFLHENQVKPVPVNKLHRAICGEMGESLSFAYYKKDCVLTVDNKHLAKGVPARILSKMIAAHAECGRELFTNREFLSDREIISEPGNPNLAIRLQRITQTLAEKCPRLEMKKVSRGRFSLNARCKIRYHEHD